jgi:outer membrane protein assembly factor BamB
VRGVLSGCAGLILAASGLAAPPEVAGDWPRFLGPRADNISRETGLIEKWPPKGPPLLWSKAIGTGYGAPSVRGNRLVLHHRLGGEEIVESFDATTGATQWRHAYPSKFVDPYGYNNGPRCTPLLTSNRCYTFGAEGRLLCLVLETGQPVWQRDTAKDWQVPEAFFGVGSTPLLEEDKLIVMVGGQPNAGVVALDAKTGRTIWESVGRTNWEGVVTIGWRAEAPYRWTGVEKLASYSTPVAATIHGRRHLLCLMRQGLVSLNPTNGEVNFSRWFQSQANDSVNAMCPLVQDDLVLISAAYYRVGAVLLRVKPDGKSFDEVWRIPEQPMLRDPATGQFTQPVLEIHWNTPVLHNGHLYAFSGRNEPDATFRCVELTSGKLMWNRDERWPGHPPPGTKAQPPVYGRGSAILAEGKLITLGEGGLLGLFRVNPQLDEEISRWQVPDLHYPCWAAPVLSRKKLYLRSEDRLVCLNLAK